MSDEEIRQLVRLAHAEDTAPDFDVGMGLREVLVRVDAGAGWAHLEGRERHAACLIAARDGDKAAFGALVTDLTPLVWHVARGNGLGRTEAEDVVQNVWLALLRHVHRLADPRALAAWLITTTRREANHLRRRSERSRVADLAADLTDQLPAPDPSPEDEVLRGDRDRTLWRAFQQLNQKCQELLRLTVLAGRAEYRVVAEAMHMPVGGIGPTRGRCLKTLRGYYERESER